MIRIQVRSRIEHWEQRGGFPPVIISSIRPIQVIDHINLRRTKWLANHAAPVGPRTRSVARTTLTAIPNIAGIIVTPVKA